MLFEGYGRFRLFIVLEMSFVDFVRLDAFGVGYFWIGDISIIY